jgi:hypothetical protein
MLEYPKLDPRRPAMPRSWSKKDEKMYDHVKESELDRGMDPARAEEIAARTVNKARREEGRTLNKTTQGTGNPTVSYDDRTRDELYNIAKEKDVPGRSKMGKQELIDAIRGR